MFIVAYIDSHLNYVIEDIQINYFIRLSFLIWNLWIAKRWVNLNIFSKQCFNILKKLLASNLYNLSITFRYLYEVYYNKLKT